MPLSSRRGYGLQKAATPNNNAEVPVMIAAAWLNHVALRQALANGVFGPSGASQ